MEITHTDTAHMRSLSLEEDEFAVFFDDPIYQRAVYYSQRNCETCKYNRPAKASHCNTCQKCVNGWDHHCVALNNCVGRRNLRPFVAFLVVSSLTSGLTGLTAILQVTSWEFGVSMLTGLLIFAITAFLTVKARGFK